VENYIDRQIEMKHLFPDPVKMIIKNTMNNNEIVEIEIEDEDSN